MNERKVVTAKGTLTNAQALDKLCKCEERTLTYECLKDNREYAIYVDGVLAVRLVDKGSIYFVSMMPDIFTFSEWSGVIDTRTIKFDIGVKDHLTVSFTTQPVSLSELIQTMYSALVELNLYGYIYE